MRKLSWIGVDCLLNITKNITIWEYVQIAPKTMIFTHDSSRNMKNPIEKEVVIGDNAYIDTGAIVGAGAVVTGDVEDNTVVSACKGD